MHHITYIAYLQKRVILGYAIHGHAYRVYNNRLRTIEESMHVIFDETNLELQDQVSNNANDEEILLEIH